MEQREHFDPKAQQTLISILRIAIALGSVAAVVIVGLVIFLAWGYNGAWRPSYRRGRAHRDAGLQAWSDDRKAEQRFADLEAQNHLARTHQTKKDSTRPDVFISLPATAVISAEGQGPQIVGTSPIAMGPSGCVTWSLRVSFLDADFV
jgi:hypothetical protein